jgi:cytoskeletal protein CcmA (bactofilin family)
MNTNATIGPTIRITGEVIASEPLLLAGHVDGSIEVSGHGVIVSASGRLEGRITADTVVVEGTVNGRLDAVGRIVVRETANIEGELFAPSVSLADGALVHGRVETAAGRGGKVVSLAS